VSRAGLARRAGWGVADQALVSLTNFGLGVVAARELGAVEFGAFAIAFSAYLIAISVTRAVSTQPLAIRYTDSRDGWGDAASAALGLITVIAVIGSAGLLVTAGIVGGPPGPAFLGIAIALPSLLIQDGWRSVLFTAGRGGAAFTLDLIVAVVLGGGVLSLAVFGWASLLSITLCWGVAATIASIVGVAVGGVAPSIPRAERWLREHRDITGHHLTGDLSVAGALQLTMFAVGLIAGLAAAGSIRGAQLLVGPVLVFAQGIFLVAVPEGTRLLKRSLDHLRRAVAGVTWLLGAIFAGWTAVLLLLPPAAGHAMLGASWEGARSVLVPMALAWAGLTATTGPIVGLRVLAAAQRTLRASLVSSALILGGGVAGAWIGGGVGAAWGLAIALSLSASLWFWEFGKGADEHRERKEPSQSLEFAEAGPGGT